MGVTQTMRIGMMAPFYPVPADVPADRRVDWLINRSAELGCTCMNTFPPGDAAAMARVRELAESKNIELESCVMGVFGLVGPDAATSRQQVLQSIAIAEGLGCKVVRCGYGRLNAATSRYSREIPLAEHMNKLVVNLKEAGKIFADHGIKLAIETHCDFTGKEFATIFSEVNSPFVGAALDTANGFTVFCDPNEDCEVLAPFAFTTHMKDMRIVDLNQPGKVPTIPVGVSLGEGNVDIPRAVRLLAEKSPCAEGLHLIIELGWEYIPEGKTHDDMMLEQFHASIAYLKKLIA
jgi:sugar phosphate isomerase/epimerase